MAAAGLGVSLLALIGIDQFLGAGGFRQHGEDLLLGAINLDAEEFDSLSSLESCINWGRAFWIVHRGYLARQGYSTETEHRDYPLYPRYWQNTTRLLNYLERSGEPTFLVIEDRVFQGGLTTDPVPVCMSAVVTINQEGLIKKYVHTQTGIQEQSLPRIINFLEKSGIKTLCFAGEVAHKGISGTGGCVIGTASYFVDKFDIKGVEGCVYPLNPPRVPNAIQTELYFDTIPIPIS